MRWFYLALIRLYQKTLTRYTPKCPMTVSCSEYAYQSIHAYGVRDGLALTVARLQVCGKEENPDVQESDVRESVAVGRTVQRISRLRPRKRQEVLIRETYPPRDIAYDLGFVIITALIMGGDWGRGPGSDGSCATPARHRR